MSSPTRRGKRGGSAALLSDGAMDSAELVTESLSDHSSGGSSSRTSSPSPSAAAHAGSTNNSKNAAASPAAIAAHASELGTVVSSAPSSSRRDNSDGNNNGWAEGRRLLLGLALVTILTVVLGLVALWILGAARFSFGGRPGAKFDSSPTSSPLGAATTNDGPTDTLIRPPKDALVGDEPAETDQPRFSIPPHGETNTFMILPGQKTEASQPLYPVANSRVDPHSGSRVREAHVFAVEKHAELVQAYEEAVAKGTLPQPREKPANEQGTGEMDHNTGHLLLRSTPRARAVYAPTPAPQEGGVSVAIVGHPQEVQFSIETNNADNASLPLVRPLAAPFIVHVQGPCTSQTAARMRDIVSAADAGGYFVDKYVHVESYLLVPTNDTADELSLLRTLQANKPFVQSFHKYEEQDKIDPYLYAHCDDRDVMLREAEDGILELTVELFRAAMTGGYRHAHEERNFARETAQRMASLHALVPRGTRRLISKWGEELQRRGAPWSNVSIDAEAAHIVLVLVPVEFWQQSAAADASTAHPASFCALLSLFASHPLTEYVERAASFITHNKHATPLVQTGTYAPRPSTLHRHGLTGRGQIVTVADTGVAHGHCFFADDAVETPVDRVDFTHRKLVSYINTRGKDYDLPNGHGSHTAASIAGRIDPARIARALAKGDLAQAELLKHLSDYDGVAYEARLAVFDVNDGLTPGKIRPPRDIYAKYYQLAFDTMGARISSNSWGARNGSYIVECAETDRFVWDHPEFLPIFSSGNYGDKGVQSVVSPGTAKNALCVGATANVMLVAGAPKAYYCAVPLYSPFTSSLADTSSFTAIGDGSGLAALARSGIEVDHVGFEDESVHMSRLLSTVSGTGQTYDTRFKPELLAPGQYIVSARSGGDPTSVSDRCEECGQSLQALYGTSMSAAITAGAAAMVRQYYIDGYYPSGSPQSIHSFTPSGALLKATLIHSAVPDTVESAPGPGFSFAELDPHAPDAIPRQTGPTPKSGFGRLQLDTALKLRPASASPLDELEMFVVDQAEMRAGGFHAYCFRVRDSPQAAASSGQAFLPSSSSSSLPFRATLVWSDPPAALSAAWLLINDLDLSVSDPSSNAVHVGNAHYGDPSPQYDTVNNVEQVTLPADSIPPGTLLSVHVRGAHVPQGPQPYALVVTGAMDPLPLDSCAGGVVCPSRCSQRGVCSDTGTCECATGFGGVGCEIAAAALPLCTRTRTDIPHGKWGYFYFDVAPPAVHAAASVRSANANASPSVTAAPFPLSPPSAPSLRVQLHALSGQPDLYVARGRFPTLQEHDYAFLLASSGGEGSAVAPLLSQVDVPVALPGRYFIGVYSYCCSDSSFLLHAARCAHSTRVNSTYSPPPGAKPCECVEQ